ncbi:zinc-dependent alcohol dehydrogenase [Candidatus Poriferisodalis sp.]|uniref:zinc-dependent alcohol dehydrogenase n=1 Tax=Candidatus Poriferisodalis sp. TaxID=3101277 RepID=UPI003B028200
MKAGRMVEVGRMECEEIPVPSLNEASLSDAPSTVPDAAFGSTSPDFDVLIRSEMASICGSDLHMVMMGAGLAHRPPCPHGFPGHEGIGTVVESRAPGLAEGTHVLTFPNPPVGECFNAYQRVNSAYCVPLPAGDVPRSQMLMAQQLGTVIYAMRRHPRDVSGETVMVMGQGSAGLFFTYLLKRAGAQRVIVSDLSAARLAVAQAYGADECLNAAELGNAGVIEAVRDMTDGVGADYVVEAVGRSDTFLDSVELARIDGALLWFGLPSTDDNIHVRFQKFFRKRLTAASTYGAQEEPGAMSFRQALRLIASGAIDVSPLLSHVFDVSDIGDAFRLAHEPHDAGALKVSVRFD